MEAVMDATDPRHSVDYWRQVSCRWKVIALAAISALVLVLVLGSVALVVESSAKLKAFERIEELQNKQGGGFQPNLGGFPALRDREAVERLIEAINAAGKKEVDQRW
jgi:hypothetical protein